MKIIKKVDFFDNGVHTKKYYFLGIRYLKKIWSPFYKETYLFKKLIKAHYPQGKKHEDLQEYKTKDPLISVIVASYNYENYIRATLDSLVAQTYKNFEVIVVDDGSKDNSVNIIKEYVKKYPFINLYQHKDAKNMGLPATIKLGIDKSKGEYIAFCESDDYWTPDHLQEKVNVINKTGPVFIVNDINLCGEPTPRYKKYIKEGLESLPKKISFCNIVDTNIIATWSCVMIRADVLRMCNFNSVIPAWVDWWVYRQILTRYPLYYINKKLTMWRIHDSYNTPEKNSKYEQLQDNFIEQNNKLIGLQTRVSENNNIIKNSKYWDEKYYVSLYENKLKGMNPVEHYLHIGWKQGYNPSKKFDTNAYLCSYIDVFKSNFNPLLHYEMHGKQEGKKVYVVDVFSEYSVKNVLKKVKSSNKKVILLFSHELSLTGAPRALLNLAISLKKQGFYPIIFAWQTGDIAKEIIDNGIDLVIDLHFYINLLNKDNELIKLFSECNLMVFNTLVSLHLVDVFPDVPTKKIVWLHEGAISYNPLSNIINLKETFKFFNRIYSVGKYSKSFADKYISDKKKSDILLYGIEDVNNDLAKKHKLSECVKFILPGAVSLRKGHDVLLSALNKLPQNIKHQIEVYIAGPCCDDRLELQIINKAKTNKNIKYLHAIPHDELMKLYADMDVILCPSRDDPMPIVCTEAFAMNKVVIVSENTGTASFIKNGENGFVIPSEDSDALAEAMIYVVKNKDKLQEIGKKSRQIYDKNFSEKVFDENVKKIFHNL